MNSSVQSTRHTKIFKLVIAASLTTFVACAADEALAPHPAANQAANEDPSLSSKVKGKTNGIELSARVLKCSPQDQVVVRVTLKNAGKVPINEEQGNNAPEYFVRLWDSEGQSVPPNVYGQRMMKYGAVRSTSLIFRNINPGQSWTKEMNVSSWFDFQAGQTYKLSVRCPHPDSGSSFSVNNKFVSIETGKATFMVLPIATKSP